MMLGMIALVALIGNPVLQETKVGAAASAQVPAVAPKDANVLIKDALADAKKSGRVVFVRFTATWCGWCRLMEKTLDEPAVRERFDKQFVVSPWMSSNREQRSHSRIQMVKSGLMTLALLGVVFHSLPLSMPKAKSWLIPICCQPDKARTLAARQRMRKSSSLVTILVSQAKS